MAGPEVGDRGVLAGLRSRPDLNGRRVEVRGPAPGKDGAPRLAVRLLFGAGAGTVLKVKAANLELDKDRVLDPAMATLVAEMQALAPGAPPAEERRDWAGLPEELLAKIAETHVARTVAGVKAHLEEVLCLPEKDIQEKMAKREQDGKGLLVFAMVFVLVLVLVQLKTVSEYDDIFVAVNKNKPVRLYKNVQEWKSIGKYLEQYFHQHYRLYLKSTEHPQVPHLNVDGLMKYIDEGDYIRKMGLGYEELINEIEALNTCYRLHWKELLHTTKYLSNAQAWAEKCEQKNPNRPLYLGMFRKFEWVDRILLRVTNPTQFPSYTTMKHVPVNYRGKIYKPVRRSVWNKRNNGNLSGFCYVCKKGIHYDDFECGHVVSVFAGGASTVDNLEPICRMCNSDMGIEHLETFKQAFWANVVADNTV